VPVQCADCLTVLSVGRPRYKQKAAPHRSLCEGCVPADAAQREALFIRLRNTVEEVSPLLFSFLFACLFKP
jgi:hypothetical protein